MMTDEERDRVKENCGEMLQLLVAVGNMKLEAMKLSLDLMNGVKDVNLDVPDLMFRYIDMLTTFTEGNNKRWEAISNRLFLLSGGLAGWDSKREFDRYHIERYRSTTCKVGVTGAR